MSTDGKSSVGIDCADEGNQQILPPHVSGCVHLIGGVPVVSVGVSTKLLPAFSVSAHASKKAVVGFWDVSRRLFQSTYMISITAAKGEQSSPPGRRCLDINFSRG